MSILLGAIFFIVIIALFIIIDISYFARIDRKELDGNKRNEEKLNLHGSQAGIEIKQELSDTNSAEVPQANGQSKHNQTKEKKQRLIYVPNLKIWAFGAVIGLAIFSIPVIYKSLDIIFNTGWQRPFPRFYHRFTAWPYLIQIFGWLFILGVIGIFAYALVKISKDD